MATDSCRYWTVDAVNNWTGQLSVAFRDLRNTEPLTLNRAVAGLEESAGVAFAASAVDNLMEQAKLRLEDPRMRKLMPYILLYSAEQETRPPVYKTMNERCYVPDRKVVMPFVHFMYGLIHALAALPPLTSQMVVWRGVRGLDLRKFYPNGATVVWWGCGICTTSLELLEREEQFCGTSGLRTIFNIQLLPNTRARSIAHMSLVPSESEILIPFGTTLEVLSSADISSDGLCLIQLKEKDVQDKELASIWEEAHAAAGAGGAPDPAAPPPDSALETSVAHRGREKTKG